jgi:hypothetical protein
LKWGCLTGLWVVLIARIQKTLWGKLIFGVLEKTLFWGVLGAWMTFKKPEIDKTLRNGLSMIETDPLNHKWLDFAI